MNCAKRLTAPSKSNTVKAQSLTWKQEWKYEARRSIHHLLCRLAWPLDLTGRTKNLASVSVPDSVGRRRSSLCRISRSQLLDRNSRQHAEGSNWLRDFGRARDGPGLGRSQQQVSGRDHGRAAGELAKFAQHLLVAVGAALVWAESECYPLRGDHGIAVVRDPRHGRRTETDAEDLWHGGSQLWSPRLQPVLVCAAARESFVHRFRAQEGMGICPALTY